MSKFITKDDEWGIRRSIRKIWDSKTIKSDDSRIAGEEELRFNAFFNQFVPETWKESKATVLRHIEAIKTLIQNSAYQINYVWIRRNNQLKCVKLNPDLARDIKDGRVGLPTYLEIEEEKMKWQRHPEYRTELGKSVPIKEEMISLRIIKK